jgi:hypothetical protein
LLQVESVNFPVKEVSGYDFKFKAAAFANNETLQNWTHNGKSIEFSDNFDWINGGLFPGDS